MIIILKELDKEKLNSVISTWLDFDNNFTSCVTNFKDIIIDAIIQTVSEILQKDCWETQYFGKNESGKLFEAFMKNLEFTIRLNKKIDEQNYEFDEVVIKFDISENKKKEIAEIYLENLLNSQYYFDECLTYDLNKKDVNSISEILSNEVCQLLSPEEIKAKFGEKIIEDIKQI